MHHAQFAADDTTPDVEFGTRWITSITNTADRTITALEGGQIGEVYHITPGTPAGTYKTVLDDASSLRLNTDWDDTVSTRLILLCVGSGEFIELSRL